MDLVNTVFESVPLGGHFTHSSSQEKGGREGRRGAVTGIRGGGGDGGTGEGGRERLGCSGVVVGGF